MQKRRTIKTTREKGVKLYAKLSDGTRLPWTSKKTKLAKLCAHLTEKQWSLGVDVEVKYQKDVSNSGTFYNWNQINNALLEWMDPNLVEYATEGVW